MTTNDRGERSTKVHEITRTQDSFVLLRVISWIVFTSSLKVGLLIEVS